MGVLKKRELKFCSLKIHNLVTPLVWDYKVVPEKTRDKMAQLLASCASNPQVFLRAYLPMSEKEILVS